MSNGILFDVPEVIRTYNISRSISKTTGLHSIIVIAQTAVPNISNEDISPAACIGFVILILTTVLGNLLVLSALFLDKRLHSPSFFLIANMAVADLLLGIFVLPFSSTLELLDNHWIFGEGFCLTWLAIDVLCCTASIIGLMAVSIDRYIGVTRPLTYSSIMTTRRTIYLIIIVWAVSILTSVVPLFGLTDHVAKSEPPPTCQINQNTFYTIFSSLISFYIPVIILLILYSRVYQEAKKQGEKLENEKRRLYQLDYQIASENIRQQQNQSNGHPKKDSLLSSQSDGQYKKDSFLSSQSDGQSKKDSLPSNQSDDQKTNVSSPPLNLENIPDEECCLDRTLTLTSTDLKNKNDDDTSHSGSSNTPKKSFARRVFGKRLYSTIRRNSFLRSTSYNNNHNHSIVPTDELLLIRRKLHNLKREKKAFRTVGLILGALLICWLPFFVTLPIMSILKHESAIEEKDTVTTWFKIAFWLGYCNSALNPFVYAFSNRAIRRAFRQVIFRRCCCCMCRAEPIDERQIVRRQRVYSGSLTTETSQIIPKRASSFSADCCRTMPKTDNGLDTSANSVFRGASTGGPVVSFVDFLSATSIDDDDDDQQKNAENPSTPTKDNPISA